jgi:hypothetical protein
MAFDQFRSRTMRQLTGVVSKVEIRFFGGLTLEETAEALQISRDTVKRDWKMAKVWLLRELRGGKPDGV